MDRLNTLTLFEGVLNNDELVVLTGNYYFKNHNKAKAKLVYYTYANEWGNHKHEKYFKTLENACKWYEKHMLDRVIFEGACWIVEGSEADDKEAQALAKLVNDNFSTALENMTDKQKQDAIDEWETMTLYCELV